MAPARPVVVDQYRTDGKRLLRVVEVYGTKEVIVEDSRTLEIERMDHAIFVRYRVVKEAARAA